MKTISQTSQSQEETRHLQLLTWLTVT